MALYKIQNSSKWPYFILIVSQALAYIILYVFCWRKNRLEFLLLFFRVIVYQFLELRCLLLQSLEYLLCLLAMGLIKIGLCVLYWILETQDIKEILCDTIFRVVSYSFLLYYFSSIFRGRPYFLYVSRDNEKCIFFEGALLNNLMEMQLSSLILYEFSKLLLIEIRNSILSKDTEVFCCVFYASVKIAIYIESFILATRNKMVYWAIFGTWIYYIINENIMEGFKYVYIDEGEKKPHYIRMERFWKTYYLLNIALVFFFFLYCFLCGKRTHLQTCIFNQRKLRIPIQ